MRRRGVSGYPELDTLEMFVYLDLLFAHVRAAASTGFVDKYHLRNIYVVAMASSAITCVLELVLCPMSKQCECLASSKVPHNIPEVLLQLAYPSNVGTTILTRCRIGLAVA